MWPMTTPPSKDEDEPGSHAPNLHDHEQPAHPALPLLADRDGKVKAEFEEFAGDGLLGLDPGSMLPVWRPREAENMSERSLQE